MAERHRLGDLQMGEAGHDAGGVLACTFDQSRLQGGERPVDPGAGARGPTGGSRSPPGRCATAPCAAARRHRRSGRLQAAFDLHVDVFKLDMLGNTAASYSALDGFQTGDISPRHRRPTRCPAHPASRHAPCCPIYPVAKAACRRGWRRLSRASSSAGPAPNRPPHMLLESVVPRVMILFLLSIGPLFLAACDRETAPAGQAEPANAGQVGQSGLRAGKRRRAEGGTQLSLCGPRRARRQLYTAPMAAKWH
jgi:hypothetical protein